jgi:hypothetical protein
LSLGVPVASEPAVNPLVYFDVILVVVAAPILLLIGVSADGYGLGGGAWIVLRLLGIGLERALAATAEPRTQISLRMGYMLGRLFLLALAVIVARQAGGQSGGITALAVIVVAFTAQLATLALNRPRSRP